MFMPQIKETPLEIGGIKLPSAVMLAPMAGYTDMVFRCIVRETGWPGLAFSEMVNPKSMLFGGGVKRDWIIMTSPADRPLAWQLYGENAEALAEGARWLADQGATMLDINMGCPKRKIARRGAGAGLLKNPETAFALVNKVVNAVQIPVSAKIRLGWDEVILSENGFINALEDSGVSAITVHARTSLQGYSGNADWQQIRFVAETVKNIPVIGNGDITDPEQGLQMIKETGCNGIMIGRAALKNPWIIRDTHRLLSGLPALPPPGRDEIFRLINRHFETIVELAGEKRAPLIFQKWIPIYSKTIGLDKPIMITLIKTRDTDTLRKLLTEYAS